MTVSQRGVAGLVVLALATLAPRCSAPERGSAPAAGARPEAAVPAASPASAALAEALCDSPRVRVQVIELSRIEPEVVLVKFVLTNPGAAPLVIGDAFAEAGSAETGSLSGVLLLDEAGHRRAFVMRDGQGRPRCSTVLGPIPPGGRVAAWARFPAPDREVQRVGLQVPGLPAWHGLPVTGPPLGTGRTGPSY